MTKDEIEGLVTDLLKSHPVMKMIKTVTSRTDKLEEYQSSSQVKINNTEEFIARVNSLAKTIDNKYNNKLEYVK